MEQGEAALLGLVQGLTEFLPVSSSGHLVIAQELLATAEEGILFEIVVHVGTLAAIIGFYWQRLFALLRGVLAGNADDWRYVGKLAVGTVPAALVGVGAKDAIEQVFASPAVAGVCLVITGVLLWSTRYTLPRAHRDEPSWAMALGIGCAQAFAILPGISRSGSTVAAGLACGVAPLAATQFSFFLAIPAIAGAAILAIPDLEGTSDAAFTAYAIGGVVAALSGLAAIWLFVRLLRSQRFHWFAGYTIPAGLAFLAWLALRG